MTEPEKVQPTLDGFVGLDEPGKLTLSLAGRAYPAQFAPGQSREDRISAVHYIRFPLGPPGRRALAERARAELALDHGDYSARALLSPENVAELRGDLDQE